MDLQLGGKAFVVTGGTDGLGLATTRILLDEGACVLVCGRTQAKFDALAASLAASWAASSGNPAERLAFCQGDTADPGLPDRLRAAVLGRWGRLDGLLLSVGGPPPGKALSTDDATWREAFDSVFLGTVRLIRDLSPHVRDGGSILTILAISAKEASSVLPVSNGLRPGLAMLTKSFAEELGPRAIRVNAMLPNLFATDRLKRLIGDGTAPVGNIALGRMGDPAEFGRMATVLLSPVASYVNGAALSIDGGQLKSL